MANKISTLSHYPCQWDDLLNEDLTVMATIWTLAEVERDEGDQEVGQFLDEDDDVWDIVVDVPELTPKIVQEELDKLSGQTEMDYEFVYEEEK